MDLFSIAHFLCYFFSFIHNLALLGLSIIPIVKDSNRAAYVIAMLAGLGGCGLIIVTAIYKRRPKSLLEPSRRPNLIAFGALCALDGIIAVTLAILGSHKICLIQPLKDIDVLGVHAPDRNLCVLWLPSAVITAQAWLALAYGSIGLALVKFGPIPGMKYVESESAPPPRSVDQISWPVPPEEAYRGEYKNFVDIPLSPGHAQTRFA
ncbi:hypothetical protein FA95DRAFT_1556125 [Auriscalpium vulgare]|uniref:Uncharacterized protein n=1 Tax=Auriscalpium vulgare TaxID=40419 RepID=A0ACB8S1Z0_9AGAM|nr:hypothetical protein FA95DRAFT_1556125 [Auriscalpium vulgare]